MSWNNDSKHSTAFTNDPFGASARTWDQATETWDQNQGTWDDPSTGFTNDAKHTTVVTNDTKH